ncbi:hypothetical protein ABIE13_004385 [Ottowia thiooxydans]|uniref:Uncharacterized protein n=1 Tax=Ottowia thiooxydans TaxID=219182 RepID=A0ABV2QDY5_9BURK
MRIPAIEKLKQLAHEVQSIFFYTLWQLFFF